MCVNNDARISHRAIITIINHNIFTIQQQQETEKIGYHKSEPPLYPNRLCVYVSVISNSDAHSYRIGVNPIIWSIFTCHSSKQSSNNKKLCFIEDYYLRLCIIEQNRIEHKTIIQTIFQQTQSIPRVDLGQKIFSVFFGFIGRKKT